MAQKAIGPNFSNELVVAGLFGLPFAWSADGTIEYGADMTDPQKASVAAVYAAHDPNRADPIAAAAALLAGGLTIASAGTPALNGVYGTSGADEINITGLQVAVAANVFPGFYRDQVGNRHTMTGAEFTAIATAIMNFTVAVDEAKAVAMAGGPWVAPANTASIA
jgi:hypothetical protein